MRKTNWDTIGPKICPCQVQFTHQLTSHDIRALAAYPVMPLVCFGHGIQHFICLRFSYMHLQGRFYKVMEPSAKPTGLLYNGLGPKSDDHESFRGYYISCDFPHGKGARRHLVSHISPHLVFLQLPSLHEASTHESLWVISGLYKALCTVL